MNPRPDEDALDRLLARAPLPEPDAWFTARTLARCRNEGLSETPDAFFLARFWRWVVGGGLGACLALFCVVHLQTAPPVAPNQQDVQDAFAIVASADSDTDTSSSAPSTWQDTSL